MINQREVVTMRVPFPAISSGLATKAHMYICLNKSGNQKEFVKCQTFKIMHRIKGKPPEYFLVEAPDVARNPFSRPTTIDCDKTFLVSNVEIDRKLVATGRADICESLFTEIQEKLDENHGLLNETINSSHLSSINVAIKVTQTT